LVIPLQQKEGKSHTLYNGSFKTQIMSAEASDSTRAAVEESLRQNKKLQSFVFQTLNMLSERSVPLNVFKATVFHLLRFRTFENLVFVEPSLDLQQPFPYH
jgi:hypothetical protein